MQSGEQPATDPDADRLEEIGEGYRIYAAETSRAVDGGRTPQRLRKTLIDGRWEYSLVDDPDTHE